MTRISVYLFGVVLVSLGIVLCKKSCLGISPVSSIPYVLESVMPFSFGTLTMMFHIVNIVLQMAVIRKIWDVKILLQIPLAFLFGIVIDFLQRWITIDGTVAVYQAAALIFSILFTAMGMVCMIDMNLVQNPPDGLVRQLSRITGLELGKMKNCYDIFCVVVSVMLGMVCLHYMKGFGIATVVSAIFVGKTVGWIRVGIERYQNKTGSDQQASV